MDELQKYLTNKNLRLIMFGDMWSLWADTPPNSGYNTMVNDGKTIKELNDHIATGQ